MKKLFNLYLDSCSYTIYNVIVATSVITLKGEDKMSNNKQMITDAEYQIMKILWKEEREMTVSEVAESLDENEWTPSTISTFLQRLLKKGAVNCNKKGKSNLYYPVLKQKEYDMNETDNFLTKIYKGSVKNLVAALYENKKLSKKDIDDLKNMFDLE